MAENPAPIDHKAVLTALGTDEATIAQLEKGELKLADVIAQTTTKIGETQKTRHLTEWEKEHKAKIESETQIGTYNALEKKLYEQFAEMGITEEEFKAIPTKRTEKIFEKLKKTYLDKQTEYDAKLKLAGDNSQNVVKLTEDLNAAKAQLVEFEKLRNSIPELEQKARLAVENEYYKKDLYKAAFSEITNLLPSITFKTFMAVVKADGYDVEVVDAANGKYIIKDAAGQVVKSPNPQIPFANLKDFFTEVASKEKWLAQSNEPQKHEGNPADPTKKEHVVKTW